MQVPGDRQGGGHARQLQSERLVLGAGLGDRETRGGHGVPDQVDGLLLDDGVPSQGQHILRVFERGLGGGNILGARSVLGSEARGGVASPSAGHVETSSSLGTFQGFLKGLPIPPRGWLAPLQHRQDPSIFRGEL